MEPWRVFFALAGPFMGTFVATLASAWPAAPKQVLGRSRCARCGAVVPLSAQVPLLSYAVRKGRRTCCGGRIPRVYPIGEAWGAGVGLLAALEPGAVQASLAAAAGFTMIHVGLVDLRRFSIDLRGLAVLFALMLADAAWRGSWPAALSRLATGAVLGSVFAALAQVRRDPGGRRGMGDGDALLAGVVGTLVGWRLAAPTVAAAAIAPLLIQLISRRRGPAPLGLWLCAAATPAMAFALSV